MSRREIIQELEKIKQQTRDLGTFISIENLIGAIAYEEDSQFNGEKNEN